MTSGQQLHTNWDIGRCALQPRLYSDYFLRWERLRVAGPEFNDRTLVPSAPFDVAQRCDGTLSPVERPIQSTINTYGRVLRLSRGHNPATERAAVAVMLEPSFSPFFRHYGFVQNELENPPIAALGIMAGYYSDFFQQAISMETLTTEAGLTLRAPEIGNHPRAIGLVSRLLHRGMCDSISENWQILNRLLARHEVAIQQALQSLYEKRGKPWLEELLREAWEQIDSRRYATRFYGVKPGIPVSSKPDYRWVADNYKGESNPWREYATDFFWTPSLKYPNVAMWENRVPPTWDFITPNINLEALSDPALLLTFLHYRGRRPVWDFWQSDYMASHIGRATRLMFTPFMPGDVIGFWDQTYAKFMTDYQVSDIDVDHMDPFRKYGSDRPTGSAIVTARGEALTLGEGLLVLMTQDVTYSFLRNVCCRIIDSAGERQGKTSKDVLDGLLKQGADTRPDENVAKSARETIDRLVADKSRILGYSTKLSIYKEPEEFQSDSLLEMVDERLQQAKEHALTLRIDCRYLKTCIDDEYNHHWGHLEEMAAHNRYGQGNDLVTPRIAEDLASPYEMYNCATKETILNAVAMVDYWTWLRSKLRKVDAPLVDGQKKILKRQRIHDKIAEYHGIGEGSYFHEPDVRRVDEDWQALLHTYSELYLAARDLMLYLRQHLKRGKFEASFQVVEGDDGSSEEEVGVRAMHYRICNPFRVDEAIAPLYAEFPWIEVHDSDRGLLAGVNKLRIQFERKGQPNAVESGQSHSSKLQQLWEAIRLFSRDPELEHIGVKNFVDVVAPLISDDDSFAAKYVTRYIWELISDLCVVAKIMSELERFHPFGSYIALHVSPEKRQQWEDADEAAGLTHTIKNLRNIEFPSELLNRTYLRPDMVFQAQDLDKYPTAQNHSWRRDEEGKVKGFWKSMDTALKEDVGMLRTAYWREVAVRSAEKANWLEPSYNRWLRDFNKKKKEGIAPQVPEADTQMKVEPHVLGGRAYEVAKKLMGGGDENQMGTLKWSDFHYFMDRAGFREEGGTGSHCRFIPTGRATWNTENRSSPSFWWKPHGPAEFRRAQYRPHAAAELVNKYGLTLEHFCP